MFIETLKSKFNYNEPIFTNEILSTFTEYSRAYIFKLINKAKIKGQILNYDNGIYYLPKETILGPSLISIEEVLKKKYIKSRDKIYGIYSGLSLQNAFSLTTQMPNTIEIISNNESMRTRKFTMHGRNIIIRKSRYEINALNEKTYILLQFFLELPKNTIISDDVKKSIKNFVVNNQISLTEVFELSKYFPAKAIKNLIFNEVINDFTQ